MMRRPDGEIGFDIYAGGGQGRTPMIAHLIRGGLPKLELLAYLEAIMRTYNELGRRDNLFKARIKILVHQLGPKEFTRLVEEEYARLDKDALRRVPEAEIARIAAYFAPPPYKSLSAATPRLDAAKAGNAEFTRWVKANVAAHKMPGYAAVTISLKPIGGIPGDATAGQMDELADLADRFSLSEIRVTHEQNLVFANVESEQLPALYEALFALGLGTPNLGQITDIIACPGLDYCDLANARSIPIAQTISSRFADFQKAAEIGELKIKISGCINACGHHHVGHIGILGVDRKGVENYQISLGGSATEEAALGDIVGPAFTEAGAVEAVSTIVETYLQIRKPGETFLKTYRRVGLGPFKEKLYAAH
jgi:sulfite reductase (NADPH) hemoprotein beta-component